MKKIVGLILSAVVVCTLLLVVGTGCTNGHVKKDISFKFSNKTKVMNIPGSLLLLALTEDSGIELKKNGEITVSLKINDAAPKLINELINLEDLSEMDLQSGVDTYAKPVLPGFTLSDVYASLNLLKNSLGVEFQGLNYENEEVKKLIDSITETGHVNKDLKIPTGLGIVYRGTYKLKTLTDREGNEHTAVYIDKYSEGGEPFLIMTMTDNAETGKKEVYLRVEFMDISIYGEQR